MWFWVYYRHCSSSHTRSATTTNPPFEFRHAQLEELLGRFPDLLEAAVQLTPAAWGHVREGTHADNAMGYIRRVAEQCPQDIYAEFLSAIRGAVTGIPVEDVRNSWEVFRFWVSHALTRPFHVSSPPLLTTIPLAGVHADSATLRHAPTHQGTPRPSPRVLCLPYATGSPR